MKLQQVPAEQIDDQGAEKRSRKDAQCAASVKTGDRYRPAARHLLQQDGGDEVTADDEEDIDADEAAGNEIRLGMAQEYDKD